MEFNNLFKWYCKICLIVFILIIINSVVGDIFFRIKYSFPKVSSRTNDLISTEHNPIQKNLKNKDIIKAHGEKKVYALCIQAEYSLSGLVVTKNTNFWFRDIMRSRFDDICLMDLGIVWGQLAADKDKLYKHWKFKSFKTLGQGRMMTWKAKRPYNDMPWTLDYVNKHAAHTHIIPANANVMGALLRIKKNNVVKLDGYLVDIYTDKGEILTRTSLSRTDTDRISRGYGACEVMYVEKVQIGNSIYK